MEDEIVNFETAVLAYNKGFRDKISCIGGKNYYNYKGELTEEAGLYWENLIQHFCLYLKYDTWYLVRDVDHLFINNEFDIPIPNNKEDLFTVLNILQK